MMLFYPDSGLEITLLYYFCFKLTVFDESATEVFNQKVFPRFGNLFVHSNPIVKNMSLSQRPFFCCLHGLNHADTAGGFKGISFYPQQMRFFQGPDVRGLPSDGYLYSRV